MLEEFPLRHSIAWLKASSTYVIACEGDYIQLIFELRITVVDAILCLAIVICLNYE